MVPSTVAGTEFMVRIEIPQCGCMHAVDATCMYAGGGFASGVGFLRLTFGGYPQTVCKDYRQVIGYLERKCTSQSSHLGRPLIDSLTLFCCTDQIVDGVRFVLPIDD